MNRKKWCYHKTKLQIEEEYIRTLCTMDQGDLIDRILGLSSDSERRDWINEWHWSD